MHIYYTLYICPDFCSIQQIRFFKAAKSKPNAAVLSEAFLSVPELCCING